MKAGESLLWFDNSDERDLHGKIARAAEYYTAKYGVPPTLCFVHPGMIPEDWPWKNYFRLPVIIKDSEATVEVRTTSSVLPHHFWLGREKEEVLYDQD